MRWSFCKNMEVNPCIKTNAQVVGTLQLLRNNAMLCFVTDREGQPGIRVANTVGIANAWSDRFYTVPTSGCNKQKCLRRLLPCRIFISNGPDAMTSLPCFFATCHPPIYDLHQEIANSLLSIHTHARSIPNLHLPIYGGEKALADAL